MSFEELKEALELRAKSVLINQEEINAESLKMATLETLEAIKGREVALWAIYDFAMFRLKSFLQITPNPEDLESFRLAKRAIEHAPKGLKKQGATTYIAV